MARPGRCSIYRRRPDGSAQHWRAGRHSVVVSIVVGRAVLHSCMDVWALGWLAAGGQILRQDICGPQPRPSTAHSYELIKFVPIDRLNNKHGPIVNVMILYEQDSAGPAARLFVGRPNNKQHVATNFHGPMVIIAFSFAAIKKKCQNCYRLLYF